MVVQFIPTALDEKISKFQAEISMDYEVGQVRISVNFAINQLMQRGYYAMATDFVKYVYSIIHCNF